MTEKQEFIDFAKQGKVLTKKCTKCSHLHLATVYFCQNCGNKGFKDEVLDGKGKVVTYTIMTVPPAGFEDYAPYAWAVMELDSNSHIRVSGFMAHIATPQDLPVGTPAKIIGFDDRGIVLEKL